MPFTLTTCPVAELLKRETAEQHERSENLLMPPLTRIAGRDDYARVLRTFYGYFHPVELRVAPYITAALLPDIAERRNSALLLQDLSAMGFPARDLPLASQLPTISSTAEALGALYVLEGSTLGGRIIAKMLQKNEALALSDEQLHFFHGYGEATGPKWKTFVQLLNQQTTDIDKIIRAANETFALLGTWIQNSFE